MIWNLVLMNSIIKYLNLSHTKLLLTENSILEIQLSDDHFYIISEAKEISKAIDKISNNKICKVILVAGEYSNCDEETRKFISSDEICDKISALALVPKSLAQELIARFVINYDRPKIPAKVFKSEEEAIQWILTI